MYRATSEAVQLLLPIAQKKVQVSVGVSTMNLAKYAAHLRASAAIASQRYVVKYYGTNVEGCLISGTVHDLLLLAAKAVEEMGNLPEQLPARGEKGFSVLGAKYIFNYSPPTVYTIAEVKIKKIK